MVHEHHNINIYRSQSGLKLDASFQDHCTRVGPGRLSATINARTARTSRDNQIYAILHLIDATPPPLTAGAPCIPRFLSARCRRDLLPARLPISPGTAPPLAKRKTHSPGTTRSFTRSDPGDVLSHCGNLRMRPPGRTDMGILWPLWTPSPR